MFTILYNFNGRTSESYKMGKDAFIEAHKGKVINVELVWKQIEKDAKKEGLLTEKPKSKDKTK